MDDATTILAVLDRCCEDFSFPMLDNGYLYLAATRLSLFRSETDWAIVTEVFGFSPRAGLPNTHVQTFASLLHERDSPEKYATRDAFEDYLRRNPNHESRFFHPIDEGDWIDDEYGELVAVAAESATLRGRPVRLPSPADCTEAGIELRDRDRIHVFELCRYLAGTAREEVLATPAERRVSVPPEMTQILLLDDWRHPDLLNGERPGGTESFQQLAQVLATGHPTLYHPSSQSNTHWRNWPDGGSL